MILIFTRVVALAATMSAGASAAFAATSDHDFEAVTVEVKNGDDITLVVRPTNKGAGKPFADALIFRTHVGMAPDGIAVTPLSSGELGVYVFETDLPTDRRYQLSVAAKAQDELAIDKVVIKTHKYDLLRGLPASLRDQEPSFDSPQRSRRLRWGHGKLLVLKATQHDVQIDLLRDSAN